MNSTGRSNLTSFSSILWACAISAPPSGLSPGKLVCSDLRPMKRDTSSPMVIFFLNG